MKHRKFLAAAALLCLLAAIQSQCGCADRKPASPPPSANTSEATEGFVADAAKAATTGDKAAAKGAAAGMKAQDRAELNGGLRWEVLAGVLLMAVGAGVMWYLGPKLGGGVAIIGAGVTFGAMAVRAIEPYMDWIVWGGLAFGLLAAAFHFRKYISAAHAMAHNTEHLASSGVKDLIGKIRQRGPGVLTRLRAILHHAPVSASPTVTTNLPPKA